MICPTIFRQNKCSDRKIACLVNFGYLIRNRIDFGICIHPEVIAARRIRYYVGVHAFRGPAGRRFLCSGTRRAGDRRNRLSHGARYAAIVRPPARRDLETRNQAILRLEREGDDRAADSIRKCIE